MKYNSKFIDALNNLGVDLRYSTKATITPVYSDHEDSETKINKKRMIKRAITHISKLPSRYKNIMAAHYCEDKAFEKIAKNDVDCSKVTVFRVHQRVVGELQCLLGAAA
ncbi:MAG: hypothetical protein IT292_02895 [Deltaproteobacteria bacterium]|nr:hypothetical protein [Deltaproteobacteria bacterium]